MQKIAIPPVVLPGFEILSSFTKEDIEKLTSYLKNISINNSLNNLPQEVAELFGKDISEEIVKTIASFSELLENKDTTLEEVAKNLCESYKEQAKKDIKPNKLEVLQNNLLEIFKNYKNLGLSFKARDLLLENESNFKDSRIISDLRLVFDDDLGNKKRYGIIIHKLHIEYRNEGNLKDMFLSLDMNDLKQMKEEIERAIQKHDLIKNDYSDSIEFVL